MRNAADTDGTGQPATDALPRSEGGAPPFSEALRDVVRNLQREPVLLFGIGASIVLLGIGVWGTEGSRALAWPILAVLVVSLVVHAYLQARRASGVRGGGITALRGRLSAGRDIVTGFEGTRRSGSRRGGNIRLGSGEIEAGRDVVTGYRTDDEETERRR